MKIKWKKWYSLGRSKPLILENNYFLGFNLLNTSTKCFTTIGNEGNVLQEEWLKEDQPKAYKCVTAVSQFYKN